jgi:uncharacterized protein YndB with AHSA1/START domain
MLLPERSLQACGEHRAGSQIMVAFEAEVEIAAPPEKVWRVLSDTTVESRWMRATSTVEFLTSPAHYRQGARMRRTGRFMGMTLRWNSEITECTPDGAITFRHDGAINGSSRWELARTARGTRVRLRSEGPAPGPMKWFPGLAAQAGRAGLKSDLRRLKVLVEQAG